MSNRSVLENWRFLTETSSIRRYLLSLRNSIRTRLYFFGFWFWTEKLKSRGKYYKPSIWTMLVEFKIEHKTMYISYAYVKPHVCILHFWKYFYRMWYNVMFYSMHFNQITINSCTLVLSEKKYWKKLILISMLIFVIKHLYLNSFFFKFNRLTLIINNKHLSIFDLFILQNVNFNKTFNKMYSRYLSRTVSHKSIIDRCLKT